MSKNIVHLSNAGFDDAIKKGVTLVDFWAPWCMPCQIMGQILETVAENIGGKAAIAKLNIDENAETAAKFGVSGIPTLILFKDGKQIEKFVGVRDDQTLVAAIEKALE